MITKKIISIHFFFACISITFAQIQFISPDSTVFQLKNEGVVDQDTAYKSETRNLVWYGKYGEAIHLYESVLAQGRGERADLKNLAQLYSWNNQLDKAIGCLEFLLEKDSSDISVLKNLADYYLWAEKQNEGIRLYQHILKLEPENIDIRKSLAQLYSWNGMPAQATQEYQTIMMYDSTDMSTTYALAQNYLWNEQPLEGIRLLEKIVHNYPDSIRFHKQLAQQYMWNNMHNQAIELYRHIIDHDQTDAESMKNLALLYKWDDKNADAIQLLRHLSKIEPVNAEYRFLLGEAQYYAGDWQESWSNLSQIEHDRTNYQSAQKYLDLIRAEHRPSFKFQYIYIRDSNQITRQQIPIDFTSYRGMNWLIRSALSREVIEDDRFRRSATGYRLNVDAEHYFTSSFSARMMAGISSYSVSWYPLNLGIQLGLKITPGMNTEFSIENFELIEGFEPIQKRIKCTVLTSNWIYQLTHRLSGVGSLKLGYYSDHNSKSTAGLNMSYVLLSEEPTLSISLYTLYENFRKIYQTSSPYWTPNKLWTTYLGADIVKQVQPWLEAGFSYGLTNQKAVLSHTFRGMLNIYLSKSNHFSFLFEQLGSDVYWSENLKLYFIHRM